MCTNCSLSPVVTLQMTVFSVEFEIDDLDERGAVVSGLKSNFKGGFSFRINWSVS